MEIGLLWFKCCVQWIQINTKQKEPVQTVQHSTRYALYHQITTPETPSQFHFSNLSILFHVHDFNHQCHHLQIYLYDLFFYDF
jgi:hypothetical protein